MTIEQIAQTVHEANKGYCDSIGDTSQPSWEDAEEWQRHASFESVKTVLEHPEITSESLHNDWSRVKRDSGWVYGEVKDEKAKTHPCLVPYAELPIEQRRKDALLRAVVNSLTGD